MQFDLGNDLTTGWAKSSIRGEEESSVASVQMDALASISRALWAIEYRLDRISRALSAQVPGGVD